MVLHEYFNRTFAASDHMTKMLFYWAKDFYRFQEKAQLTRITWFFLVSHFPVCLILLLTRIALYQWCDLLQQKAYFVGKIYIYSKIYGNTDVNHSQNKFKVAQTCYC